MGEMLKVPAEYVETFREAVVDEARFWTSGMTDDFRDVREAREREDESKAAMAVGDMGDHQRVLGAAVAVLEQLPAPGTKVDVELTARAATLESICEEAVRFASKRLECEREYSPLDVDRVRVTAAEFSWWLDKYEGFSARRSAEQKAATR